MMEFLAHKLAPHAACFLTSRAVGGEHDSAAFRWARLGGCSCRGILQAAGKQQGPFFFGVLSLCLSGACLGKTIIIDIMFQLFYIKH